MNDEVKSMPVWLAVSAGGDTVRLVPVGDGSTGPDVFCKLLDAQKEKAEAVRQAERNLLLELWDALSAHEASGGFGSLRATLLRSQAGDEIKATRLKS